MSLFDVEFAKLNPEQRKAVEHIDGPMMVLAGAGTGKTQVLAMRIVYLLKMTGVGLHNILCLTFTDSGVHAMRKRLISLLGHDGYSAHIATFHSFSNEVIAEYPDKFIKTTELLPLSEFERVRFLKEVLENLPFDHPLKHSHSPLFYLSDVSSRISQLKREGISPDALAQFIDEQESFALQTADLFRRIAETNANRYTESFLDEILDELVSLGKSQHGRSYLYKSAQLVFTRARELAHLHPTQTGKISYSKLKEDMKRFYSQVSAKLDQQRALVDVYRVYLAMLAARGRYDFEDMINLVLDLLRTDESVRRDFQERYQYVLVDEYQDTNTAQNRLIDVFAMHVDVPNIFVVGDDDQAIFRFQGASLENVVGFAHTYRDTLKVVSLTHNYRSHAGVLHLADVLISNNQFRASIALPGIEKVLRPGLLTEPRNAHVFSFSQPHDEFFWVAREVSRLLSCGVSPCDIAVLARTNDDLLSLVPYMREFHVPFTLSQHEDAFAFAVVQHFVHLLAVIDNPYDAHAIFCLLESGLSGIRPLDFLRIHSYVLSHPRPQKFYFDVLGDTELLSTLGVQDILSCTSLYSSVLRWRDLLSKMSTMEFIGHVVAESGILDLCRTSGENELDNLRALGAFVSECGRFVQGDRMLTFHNLLLLVFEMIAHRIPLSMGERTAQADTVSLTTVHKAKGLEYRYVFIINATQKRWNPKIRGERVPLPINLFEYDLGVAGRLQEEESRRLFYVAITRAREYLYFTYSHHDDAGKKQLPVQFLLEMGDRYVDRQDIMLSSDEVSDRLRFSMTGLRRPVVSDEEICRYLRERLDNYVLSASHLNAYIKCPRMFYYQYFVRAPLVPNPTLVIGSAAHRAVEFLFERVSLGEDVSFDDVYGVYERYLAQSWLTGSSYTDALDRGRCFLRDYYTHRKDTIPRTVKIEFDFRYQSVFLDDIQLTGKLDLIEFIDPVARQCIVYDFKTGDPAKGIEGTAYNGDTWRQMVFYKLLTLSAPRFDHDMVKGVVEFIEPDKNGHFIQKEIFVTKDDLDLVKANIRFMWQKLHELDFRCLDSSGECQYCQDILRVGGEIGF